MQIDFATFAGAVLLVTTLALQVFATQRVRKDPGSTTEQKGMQVRLIWLLPLLGAAFVLAVLHETRPARDSSNEGQMGQRTASRPKPPTGQPRRPS